MSTLENCTDALLQQKVIQSSNYERLESRLMEMERTKRSLFFGLKEIITDVERRRQDLGELRDENNRLQQQLQQGSVKFGALSAFMGEEQKKCLKLQEILEGCATAWTGCPARVALLLRALQERDAFGRQLRDVVRVLIRVRTVVCVVRRVDVAKAILHEQLTCHESEILRRDKILQKMNQNQRDLHSELQQQVIRAEVKSKELWNEAQCKALHLLRFQCVTAAARIESTAAAELSATCRASLHCALTAVETHESNKYIFITSVQFSDWRLQQLRTLLSAVQEKTREVAAAVSAQLAALETQRALARNAQREAKEKYTKIKEEKQQREAAALAKSEEMKKKAAALKLLATSLKLFRNFEGRRRRGAHAGARRRRLQAEAREGLRAEEALVRADHTREEFTERNEKEEIMRQGVQLIVERQKQKKSETLTHNWRLTTPKKVNTQQRSRAAHTEKKRTRSHAETIGVGVRRTYPTGNSQGVKVGEMMEVESPASSGSSIGNFLTFGTRVPINALRGTVTQQNSPLKQLSTNVENNKNVGSSSKKKTKLRKSIGDSVMSRMHGGSPLPRPPNNNNNNNNNTQCALSSALSSAFSRTNPNIAIGGNNTSTDVVSTKNKVATRPRPSLLIAKETWGEGKAEDIFADVFSF